MKGRKPIPADLIDNVKQKLSKEEIERRKEVERKLKTSSTLSCPKSLSPPAKKEWKRVKKLYDSMEIDILCDLDIIALSMYCEAVAIYNAARDKWIEINDIASESDHKKREVDRCFKLMNEQTKIINQLAEQLCLTPVGRARMGNLKGKSEEDNDELSDMGF